MVIADYYYPGWEFLVDFLQSEVEKLLACVAGDWIHNLRSKFSVGVYDLLATADRIYTLHE